jgi:hypothetical protein
MQTASKAAGLIAAGITAIALVGAAITIAPRRAAASSHREAALINKMP